MYKESGTEGSTIATLTRERGAVLHPRMAWMIYFEKTKSVEQVCQKFGVSKKTFYKWLVRYKESGHDPRSLEDKSRRPHHSPNSTPAGILEQVIQAKKTTGFGQRRLKRYLETNHGISLSEHTIWKILKRHSRENGRSNSVSNKNGDMILLPGEVIQISFMEISQHCGHKPLVQYTAIDVASRLRITKVYGKHTPLSASDFLKFIIGKFPFRIGEIQTPDDVFFTNGTTTSAIAATPLDTIRGILHHHAIKQTTLEVDPVGESHAVGSEKIDHREIYGEKNYETAAKLSMVVYKFTVFYNNHRKSEELDGLTPLQKLKLFKDFDHIMYFDPYD